MTQYDHKITYVLRVTKGQGNKNPKIREKLGLARPHPPTPLFNFLYFLETGTTTKTAHKSQKNTISPQKIRI